MLYLLAKLYTIILIIIEIMALKEMKKKQFHIDQRLFELKTSKESRKKIRS